MAGRWLLAQGPETLSNSEGCWDCRRRSRYFHVVLPWKKNKRGGGRKNILPLSRPDTGRQFLGSETRPVPFMGGQGWKVPQKKSQGEFCIFYRREGSKSRGDWWGWEGLRGALLVFLRLLYLRHSWLKMTMTWAHRLSSSSETVDHFYEAPRDVSATVDLERNGGKKWRLEFLLTRSIAYQILYIMTQHRQQRQAPVTVLWMSVYLSEKRKVQLKGCGGGGGGGHVKMLLESSR